MARSVRWHILLGILACVSVRADFDQTKAKLATDGAVSVPCRPGPAYVGNLPCDGDGPTLLKTVRDELNKRFENEASWFYRGKKIRWTTGELESFPTPVCDLSAGEVDRNSLPADSSCGVYCQLRVEKSLTGVSVKALSGPGTCKRELAWYNAAWLQAKNFYRKQVLGEWGRKRVSLVDFDGARPSASAAAAAVEITGTSNQILGDWLSRFGADKVAALKCVGSQDPVASHGACHMEMLSKRLITGWVLFLSNEITMRAQKDFLTKFRDQSRFMDDAQGTIGSTCQNECKCLTCSDTQLSACANKCYQRELPKWLKGKFAAWDTPGDYPRAGAQPQLPLSVPPAAQAPAAAPEAGPSPPSSVDEDGINR